MKKLPLVLAMTAALALGGCVSTGDESAAAELSNEQIATMDRFEYTEMVRAEMEAVGFEVTPVHSVLDRGTESVNEVFKHQYELMSEYRTIAENHRDVQSFLHANKDKDAAGLEAAILAFDAQAKTQEEKIAPRLAAYEAANDKIFAKNVELAIEIAEQAYVLSQLMSGGYSQFLTAETATSFTKVGAIKTEWSNIQTRVDLAQKANELIEQDQAVVEIAKQMQTIKL
ncbi:hypothetical protein [Ferrimonas lipolytica]|uniref:Lipoprotein n=1 Tax=Ferrimonas lipolytica TaxID=2724191 RepID=A0A6H1UIE7_9GAMM|nr:hypothetical protein [Ferrimonas lipolytica]QIZ78380.1 hypothetical protein HER31_16610 [Ferrimonas lipolytica]